MTSGLEVISDRVSFEAVKEALRLLNIRPMPKNSFSSLIWVDSLKDRNHFAAMNSWQIVNRIPSINVICRKAPLARILDRMSSFFPNLFSFVPKTFVLPTQMETFSECRKEAKTDFIIKPDGGSLGQGISIVHRDAELPELEPDSLYVAQEYIESVLHDNTKFDFRIYALVASITPLKIYVYRDGLARFCSEEYGTESVFSKLTNVTLNKENGDAEISSISRLLSDFLPELESRGVNIQQLWDKIDSCVALTIIACHKFISKAEEVFCPPCQYSRCFQILGFDILLDNNYEPHVLEVNYRPSLKFHRARERRMKVSLIKDAISLAAPVDKVQEAINSRRWAWNEDRWKTFIESNPQILEDIQEKQKNAERNSKFVRVWPSDRPGRREWENVLKTVHSLPLEYIPGFKVPQKIIKGGES